MSWDDEKRIQHLKDIDRILRGEIDPTTKEELKFGKWKDLKNVPPPDYSKFRHFTRVIPRDEWGAIPAVEPMLPLHLPVRKIHYSAHRNWPTCHTKEECTHILRMLQLREINERGLPDLRHNFLIGNDCNVYEGRGWKFKAEIPFDVDPRKWDDSSLDIGFFGEKDDPVLQFEEMMSVAKELFDSWKNEKLVIENFEQI